MIGKIISKIELRSALKNRALGSVVIDNANECLEKIGSECGAQEILATCDRNGITQRGYSALYQRFKKGVRVVRHGLRVSCLPKPFHISLLRLSMNAKLKEFVGDYYSINDTMETLSRPKSRKNERIELNNHNSFFVDIEAVQKTMILLYKITTSGMYS